MQPSIPTLSAILIAIGLDVRMRLDVVDYLDGVLDRRSAAERAAQAEVALSSSCQHQSPRPKKAP
jgi:hypothetical protein